MAFPRSTGQRIDPPFVNIHPVTYFHDKLSSAPPLFRKSAPDVAIRPNRQLTRNH